MSRFRTIVVVSDIHYASPAEQTRRGYESRPIHNPILRLLAKAYRHFIWLRDPFAHNALLDRFLDQAAGADWLIANGDYSCDTAFVGVSDDAALASAAMCLSKLRGRFPDRCAAVFGDHELGKMSLFGRCGGPRLASWRRARTELALEPFWRLELGRYVLLGVVSSLVALPVYEPEALPDELPEWRSLRAAHLEDICAAFATLQQGQKLLLFCHDPTALPFLYQQEAVRARLAQIEHTIIGHLHTGLIFWKSGLLAGMPAIGFLGNSVRRMSTALRQAKLWQPFRVRLCPSLAGSELLKDGGYCSLRVDTEGGQTAQLRFHPLPRNPATAAR